MRPCECFHGSLYHSLSSGAGRQARIQKICATLLISANASSSSKNYNSWVSWDCLGTSFETSESRLARFLRDDMSAWLCNTCICRFVTNDPLHALLNESRPVHHLHDQKPPSCTGRFESLYAKNHKQPVPACPNSRVIQSVRVH